MRIELFSQQADWALLVPDLSLTHLLLGCRHQRLHFRNAAISLPKRLGTHMVRRWVLLYLHYLVLNGKLKSTRKQILFHTFQLLWARLSQRSTIAATGESPGARVDARYSGVSNDADGLWGKPQRQERPSCLMQAGSEDHGLVISYRPAPAFS